jgi:hypothetical protein
MSPITDLRHKQLDFMMQPCRSRMYIYAMDALVLPKYGILSLQRTSHSSVHPKCDPHSL